MRIPVSTKASRFYVATSLEDAFSSWDSLEDARASYVRLEMYGQKGHADSVIGIVSTGSTGLKILHNVRIAE